MYKLLKTDLPSLKNITYDVNAKLKMTKFSLFASSFHHLSLSRYRNQLET